MKTFSVMRKAVAMVLVSTGGFVANGATLFLRSELRLSLPSGLLVGWRPIMRAVSPSLLRRQTCPMRWSSLSYIICPENISQDWWISGRTTAPRPDELPQRLCGLGSRFHWHQELDKSIFNVKLSQQQQ